MVRLMARIRSIKPEACQGERMGAVSSDAERLFWRLQTHCDDHGRCQDNPRVVFGVCAPTIDGWTVEHVDALLWELASIDPERPLIWRYTDANGRRLIEVNEWMEYQKPQHAAKSKCAPFDPQLRRFREPLTNPHESFTKVPEAVQSLTVRSGVEWSGEACAGVGHEGESVDNSPAVDKPDVSEIVAATHALIGRPLSAEIPNDGGRDAPGHPGDVTSCQHADVEANEGART